MFSHYEVSARHSELREIHTTAHTHTPHVYVYVCELKSCGSERIGPTRVRYKRQECVTRYKCIRYKCNSLQDTSVTRNKGNKILSSPDLKRPAPQPAPSLHLRLVKSLKKGVFLCYSLVVDVMRKQPWLSRKQLKPILMTLAVSEHITCHKRDTDLIFQGFQSGCKLRGKKQKLCKSMTTHQPGRSTLALPAPLFEVSPTLRVFQVLQNLS